MCGIAGYNGGVFQPELLGAFVRILAHRGPDESDTFSADGVGLAHTRLRIIDLTLNGRQPMKSLDGRYTLVFNGEIYNYLELKAELCSYKYSTQTDTEVVLAAFDRWGTSALKKFVGMFAFGIWDSETRELILARDHVGIKPLYFSLFKGGLVFGSEIKAILTAGVAPKANLGAIKSYLLEGLYDHTDETFFKDIFSLTPGHYLVVKEGRILSKHAYWEPSTNVFEGDQAQATEELHGRLRESIRLQQRSDVPIGLHLTGGLDSSGLFALMQQQIGSKGRLACFTGAYGDPKYDEDVHALELSSSKIASYYTATLKVDDFWHIAKKVQYVQEQPYGGIGTLVYWPMEDLARSQGLRVLLEGQGSDELFGGYRYYARDYLADLQTSGREEEYRRFIDQALSRATISSNDLLFANQSKLPVHQDGSFIVGRDAISPELMACESLAPRRMPFLRDKVTTSRFRDLLSTKLPRVLRFNDRMSMAFGIELRVPYLDHRLVEFGLSLPASIIFHEGYSKWPLRSALRGSVPDSVRLAAKRPMVTPQREWFRGPLRHAITARFDQSDLTKSGLLLESKIKSSFEAFCQNESEPNSFHIWQWLNLDLWVKEWNVVL